jgi:hypothetical protein
MTSRLQLFGVRSDSEILLNFSIFVSKKLGHVRTICWPEREEMRILARGISAIRVFMSIMVLACCPSVAKAGAVTSGLIAYWSFDAATIQEDMVEDVFGESDGKMKGDPQIDKGKIGESLLFDGAIDCVLVNSETLNRDYSAITLECWVFINALDDSWNRILSLDDTDAGNQNVVTLYYDDDDNQYGFFVRAGGNSTDAAKDLIQEDIPLEEWIHMVGVWDGKTAKFYENGKLKLEHPLPGAIEGGNLFFGIGDRADGENADTIQGFIDEVRIYERALSEAEVQQNYRAEGLAVTVQNTLSITWGKVKQSDSYSRGTEGLSKLHR